MGGVLPAESGAAPPEPSRPTKFQLGTHNGNDSSKLLNLNSVRDADVSVEMSSIVDLKIAEMSRCAKRKRTPHEGEAKIHSSNQTIWFAPPPHMI